MLEVGRPEFRVLESILVALVGHLEDILEILGAILGISHVELDEIGLGNRNVEFI